MASYLYYHGPEGFESPLTDDEYDQRVDYVVKNWAFTSPEFRKRITRTELAASGFTLKATPAEQEAALKWAKEKKNV